MNLNQFVRNLTAPEPPYICELAAFPIPVVPIALGALELRTVPHIWASPEDAYRGTQLIRSLQVALLTGCMKELIESNRQIYRLLDTTLNGAIYVADELDGEIIVTPPIPAAPADVARSVHSRLERLEQLLDNAYNGATYAPDFLNATGVRQQLSDLILAIQQQGQLDDDMLAELINIVTLLA
jgi:hypothetical protein